MIRDCSCYPGHPVKCPFPSSPLRSFKLRHGQKLSLIGCERQEEEEEDKRFLCV